MENSKKEVERSEFTTNTFFLSIPLGRAIGNRCRAIFNHGPSTVQFLRGVSQTILAIDK